MKLRSLPAEVYTRAEVEALCGECGRGPCGRRTRAMIILLWRSGLRISEALALRTSDIDELSGTMKVRHGKGGRPRTVALDAIGFAGLDAWLADRQKLGLLRAPLFCTLYGGRLSASYCRAAFHRLGRKAGIKKRVHPHGLRHTLAVELERDGIKPSVIQAQLGHTSLGTTTRYLAHLTAADLVEAIRGRAT